jgi:hypothetical protein
MRKAKLTVTDQLRIAAECVVDPRTVKRVYAGERCTSTTIARVSRTAKALGLPLPDRRAEEVA